MEKRWEWHDGPTDMQSVSFGVLKFREREDLRHVIGEIDGSYPQTLNNIVFQELSKHDDDACYLGFEGRPGACDAVKEILARLPEPSAHEALWTGMEDPWLNLGCGGVILPGEQPPHHILAPAELYEHQEWLNVDREGDDIVAARMNLFQYPWDLPSDSFGGALLAHICEHIPHWIESDEPKFHRMHDGWFCFFAELWRVLKDGAKAYVIVPHGLHENSFIDPTHTRSLVPATFTHNMNPQNVWADYPTDMNFHVNPSVPFMYDIGLLQEQGLWVNDKLAPAADRFAPFLRNVAAAFCVELTAVKGNSDADDRGHGEGAGEAAVADAGVAAGHQASGEGDVGEGGG